LDDITQHAGAPVKKAETPAYAIETRGLRKVYRARSGQPAKEALKGVDLAIPTGSIFGLLGPNGAGKSTFINILAGLVIKTAGAAAIWGHDIDADPMNARGAIGIVPQEINMDPFFSPGEALEIQAGPEAGSARALHEADRHRAPASRVRVIGRRPGAAT